MKPRTMPAKSWTQSLMKMSIPACIDPESFRKARLNPIKPLRAGDLVTDSPELRQQGFQRTWFILSVQPGERIKAFLIGSVRTTYFNSQVTEEIWSQAIRDGLMNGQLVRIERDNLQ